MSAAAPSDTPLRDALNQSPDIPTLSKQILRCATERLAMEAALFNVRRSSMIFTSGIPAECRKDILARIEHSPELSRELPEPRDLSQPSFTFAEGAAVFLCPIAHAGTVRFTLCLYAPKWNREGLSRQQVKNLNALCDAAGAAMERLEVPEPDSLQVRVPARLLGTIAHDIRNPITAMRGYLKMVLNERLGPLSPDQKECLEGAMNGVSQLIRLAGIVGGLPGLIEQFQPGIVDLRDIWLEVREAVCAQAQKKGISIEEGQSTKPIVVNGVYGDRRLLSHAIEKLLLAALTDARQHSALGLEWPQLKSGEIALEILFCCEAVQPAVEVVVSELQPIVFLHGGNLTLATKSAETKSELKLLLPGAGS